MCIYTITEQSQTSIKGGRHLFCLALLSVNCCNPSFSNALVIPSGASTHVTPLEHKITC